MRIKVYRNLRYPVDKRYPAWSIATADSKRKLLQLSDAVILTNANLVVEQTEQQRIKRLFDRTGKRDKKVHAFVVGDMVETWPLDSLREGVEERNGKPFTYSDAGPKDLDPRAGKLSRLGYNPFIGGEFVRVDCGTQVLAGSLTGRNSTIWVSGPIPRVYVTPEGVYAKLGACAKGKGLHGLEGLLWDYDNWNGA